jgi:hypothetical protein
MPRELLFEQYTETWVGPGLTTKRFYGTGLSLNGFEHPIMVKTVLCINFKPLKVMNRFYQNKP